MENINTDKLQAMFKKIFEFGKKASRVKPELERLKEADIRIYELSRMLPAQEGYELQEIYKQTREDIIKVQKVLNED